MRLVMAISYRKVCTYTYKYMSSMYSESKMLLIFLSRTIVTAEVLIYFVFTIFLNNINYNYASILRLFTLKSVKKNFLK